MFHIKPIWAAHFESPIQLQWGSKYLTSRNYKNLTSLVFNVGGSMDANSLNFNSIKNLNKEVQFSNGFGRKGHHFVITIRSLNFQKYAVHIQMESEFEWSIFGLPLYCEL